MRQPFNHTAHKELWDWLANNPGMWKHHWPGWKDHYIVRSVYCKCFACQYAEEHSADDDTEFQKCSRCPISWPGTGTCFDEQVPGARRGLFEMWEDKTSIISWMTAHETSRTELLKWKKVVSGIARRIRDLPVKEGVPCH